MQPTLVILAAGMGSRYGGLKQIDPIGPGGEIIIDYSVYDAVRAGFGKVVFVIRRDIEEAFKESVGRRYAGVIEVDYAFQELTDLPGGFTPPAGRAKPWGTAHAVYAARDQVREPFAAINADDFYGRQGFALIAEHLREGGDDGPLRCCMTGFVLSNTLSDHGTVSRGVCRVDAQGDLRDVVERTAIERREEGVCYLEEDGTRRQLTGEEVVSMNMWGFPTAFFAHLEREFTAFLAEHGEEERSEFFLPLPVANLIRSGEATFKVLTSHDSWFGVTYPEDKPSVEASIAGLIKSGQYPEKLF